MFLRIDGVKAPHKDVISGWSSGHIAIRQLIWCDVHRNKDGGSAAELSPTFWRRRVAGRTALELWCVIPSMNFTPTTTLGMIVHLSRPAPIFFCGLGELQKMMASAVLFERHPLESIRLWLETVANWLSQCRFGRAQMLPVLGREVD